MITDNLSNTYLLIREKNTITVVMNLTQHLSLTLSMLCFLVENVPMYKKLDTGRKNHEIKVQSSFLSKIEAHISITIRLFKYSHRFHGRWQKSATAENQFADIKLPNIYF